MSTLGFTLNNNLRAQNALMAAQAIGIGTGQCNIEGSFEAYFESDTLYTKFLNFTASSLSWRMYDPAGNAYIWDFPSVKFTSGNVVAQGKDGDVMVSLGWMARKSSATGRMVNLTRFAA